MSARWAFLTLSLLLAPPSASASQPLRFEAISIPGFGDRNNTKAWSMIWWRGRLYVGTARTHTCLSRAGLSLLNRRLFPYPPRDPELGCAPDMRDLPLQGEIWRYAPEGPSWDRVFQSPVISNPAAPEEVTARDAGFRNFAVFTEDDGTDALYAFGVTSEAINPGMPPPRILRTTDGERWEPVPEDPHTFLGQLGRGQASFRAVDSYGGRLYVVNGDLLGAGRILESEDPASGGDSFRTVTPEGMSVFELATYNGQLYVGVIHFEGYSVLRTKADGAAPYAFAPVVENGADARRRRPRGPTSMHVFEGRLYVGTDSPGELIRINPDDSWDLVVGEPRWTQDGWKEPLSGLGPGFDYGWANHLHSMVEHDGSLFVSVNDGAGVTQGSASQILNRSNGLEGFAGFDLFQSGDGVEFSVITLTGFGDPRENVIRVFASTPHGLFAGTANPWSGLRVYLGNPSHDPALNAPQHLNAEWTRAGYALTWEAVEGATGYRIFRRNVGESPNFKEVGSASEAFFIDRPPKRGIHHYFVRADNGPGVSSAPSNLARIPPLGRRVTLSELDRALRGWSGRRRPSGITSMLVAARSQLRAGDLNGASSSLERIREHLREGVEIPAWRSEDAERLLGRLQSRFRLAEAGLLPLTELESSAVDGHPRVSIRARGHDEALATR